MLQSYKLRLGDGTVVTVDQDGLRTWLTDARAAVHVPGTQEWRPLRQFVADEESAARLARALVPPEPRRKPAPSPPEVPPPSPRVERAIGEPPMVQALADETGAPGASGPPWHDLGEAAGEAPVIRLKRLDDERPAPSPPEIPPPNPRLERAIGGPPLVQALAEETGAPGASAPPWRELGRVADEAPVIRLKPLDDERPAPHERWPARDRDVEGAEEDEQERHDRLEGPLLLVISTFGTLLSRCLDPLTPLVRERPVVSRPTAPRWGLPERLTGWGAGLTAWFGRLASRGRPEPPIPPGEPEARRPPVPAAPGPLPPPTPVSELPVLRFADAQEAPEEEDLYEGEAHGPFPALWLWAKRIVLLGALVTGGVLAFFNWEAWFPRAAEVGQTAFTEIDRQVRAGQRAREQEQALSDATERLPHLAPATIRLVLAASDSGALDPPEVFQLANEAADRGQSALTPAEATELRTLQRELLGHLRPPERARVAEYDRARASRLVFPFENPHALELVARGARAMPAQSRERLQELLGKAVAAGLAPAAGPPVDR
jgi:hypothetical protein